MYTFFLFLLFLCTSTIFGEGFCAGTLVKVPHGFVEIQEMREGDMVCCHDLQGRLTERPVEKIQCHTSTRTLRIFFCDEALDVEAMHIFFLAHENRWARAHELKRNTFLLGKNVTDRHIGSVIELEGEHTVYTIGVKELHNYLVTPDEILVHNFPFFGIAGCAAFGGGKGIALVSATIAIGAAGIPIVAGLSIAAGIGAITYDFIWGQPNELPRNINDRLQFVGHEDVDIETFFNENHDLNERLKKLGIDNAASILGPSLPSSELFGKPSRNKKEHSSSFFRSTSGGGNNTGPHIPFDSRRSAKVSDEYFYGSSHRTQSTSRHITNKQDREDAARLGFTEATGAPFNSHDALTFKKGNRWISQDKDSHRGGRWKLFDKRGTRKGTCDENLNLIAE